MDNKDRQFTQAEAVAFYESKEWENWTNESIVRLQLFQDRLCVPFDRFHEAITKVLGRSVWTHEFAFRDNLIREYLGQIEPPTMEDIMNLIPEEKRLVLFVPGAQ